MQIKNELQLDFKDVLIEPKRSSLTSRSEVSLLKSYKFPCSKQTWEGIPIIAANMDTVGTISMALELSKNKCLTALHKHYKEDDLIKFFSNYTDDIYKKEYDRQNYSFYSLGITDSDYKKFLSVLGKVGYWNEETRCGIKFVCIDVANGYMQNFVNFCSNFRKNHPDVIIMAGNVVTGNIVEELIFSGVDIVKVGIGPGSACTTRKVAGVGRPQLSAIIDTTDAAHGIRGLVCSDGGCTVPADVSKAFGAGADFVMLGGMLAGHDESEIEKQSINGEEVMKFYGMSSTQAMDKYSGGVADYRASEGRVLNLKYRGRVENTLREILGGVRSTCTYVGAKNLKELPKRTTFYQTTIQTNNIYENREN